MFNPVNHLPIRLCSMVCGRSERPLLYGHRTAASLRTPLDTPCVEILREERPELQTPYPDPLC